MARLSSHIKSSAGTAFFSGIPFRCGASAAPHQDMPRINHKGYGGDKQYRQRGRPQIDRCKFGAAGEVHPRHQQHFQPAHTFLPALHSEYQCPRQKPNQHGRTFFDAAYKFVMRGRCVHNVRLHNRKGGNYTLVTDFKTKPICRVSA